MLSEDSDGEVVFPCSKAQLQAWEAQFDDCWKLVPSWRLSVQPGAAAFSFGFFDDGTGSVEPPLALLNLLVDLFTSCKERPDFSP